MIEVATNPFETFTALGYARVVAILERFDDLRPGECHAGASGGFMEVDQRWIDETLEEVDHLRSLGLWTSKKRIAPATSIATIHK